MAVAFSMGGSGYTRSDFMISDAAIPQRTQEAVQDQSEKFSNVLSGIGKPGTVNSTSSPDDSRQAEIVARFTDENGKIDYKAMAKAVINGEIKLDDIPEDLMEFVLKELVELVKVDNFTDDKDDDEDTDVTTQAAAEIASMFMQPTVQADDKTEELSQLTAAPVEEVTEVIAEAPVQETPAETAVTAAPETVQAATEAVPQDTAEQPVFQAKTEQPAAKPAEDPAGRSPTGGGGSGGSR